MEKKTKKFILDIVPLVRMPLMRNQTFAYLCDQELSTGTLVEIPFSHRKIQGIVVNSRKDFPRLGNIQLKNVEKIIEEKFLTTDQIELVGFISDYYISPLGIVLKNFVPKRIKARNKNQKTTNIENRNNIILTEEQKKAVDIISDTKHKMPYAKYLLFGPSGSGKTEVYINAILKIKNYNLGKSGENGQFLILVPEKTLTPQAMERYGAYFKSEEIVLLSSNLTGGQFYANWQKIKSGEAKIIIGTRMAVFAPFEKLKLIVIDEEQDMSYKQWDMNPRYDARTVAEKLAEMHNCPLVRGSATPSIESYYSVLQKKYTLLKLPYLMLGSEIPKYKMPNTIIVDMKKERWNKNYTCISKKLKSEVEYALKNKLQTILFINRQGMSVFSVCAGCKTVLRCPKCERALVYKKNGIYKCLHCSYKTGIFPKCEKCGGIVFKNAGLGTQKVEKEISDLFPFAKILVADMENSKKKNFQNELYSKFSQGLANVLIGTQMIAKGWDLPRVALIGIIDADNLLSFPDFATEEKTFSLLVQAAGRTNRLKADFPGIVVVQTFQPENSTINLAAKKDYENFYKKEIQERKALDFPPFGKLIKLIFQDFDFKKITGETERVFKVFKNIQGIKISEPTNSFVPKIRGKFRQQMIIKYKSKNKIMPSALARELKKLNAGWIIDIDPISII
jgi:primosomal protein N' (replication factor Y)